MTIFGFDTSDPAGLQKALQASETEINSLKSLVNDTINRLDGTSLEIPAISIKLNLPANHPMATAIAQPVNQ